MTRAGLVLAGALLAGCNQHDAALEVRIEMLEEEQKDLLKIVNTMRAIDNKQTDALLVHTESIGRLAEIMKSIVERK